MNRKRPTTPQSEEAKAKRAQKRAEREATERRKAADLAARRSSQLEDARLAVGSLEEVLRETQRRQRRREDLADHLTGFYEEIDKLARGKSMLEVTDRVLEEANQIIRDAKAVVTGDTYLSRIKEFVAAGNNPVYPDVVVVLRTLRQSLERANSKLEEMEEHIDERLDEARTVEVALVLTVEQAEPPMLRTLRLRMTGDPEDVDLSWFRDNDVGARNDYSVFDLERLDEIDSLDTYFAIQEEE